MLLLLVNEFGNFMCGRMSFQFIFLAQQQNEREGEREGGGEKRIASWQIQFYLFMIIRQAICFWPWINVYRVL